MEKVIRLKTTKIAKLGRNLIQSLQLFRRNDPLRLAGATAFFANFAIPPILLILIRLFGFFVDKKIFTERIFEHISEVIIPSSTLQIRDTLRNIRNIEHQWWATLLSFVFLLFVATTLFNVIKNSVEQLWNVGQNEKMGLLFTLKSRSRSMGIILLAGLLFFVSLMTEGIQSDIVNGAGTAYQQQGKWLLWFFNQGLFTLVVSLWFTVIFRFLSNARPAWLIALKGGLLTGILFNLGRYVLRVLLPMSNIEGIYGASGSIILLMLFVFYSALIFYFGACFIRIISEKSSHDIRLKKGAFRYEIKEIS